MTEVMGLGQFQSRGALPVTPPIGLHSSIIPTDLATGCESNKKNRCVFEG